MGVAARIPSDQTDDEQLLLMISMERFLSAEVLLAIFVWRVLSAAVPLATSGGKIFPCAQVIFVIFARKVPSRRGPLRTRLQLTAGKEMPKAKDSLAGRQVSS